jgi:hypothetical protein
LSNFPAKGVPTEFYFPAAMELEKDFSPFGFSGECPAAEHHPFNAVCPENHVPQVRTRNKT